VSGAIWGELLLVDDDAVFARVLGRALTARGFSVHWADSAAEALKLLKSPNALHPDFAILDLNLAGSSGLKLIGAVREASSDCRILLLTGYASISTAVDAIKLGADQYLAKPIEIDAIVRSLTDVQAPDEDDIGEGAAPVSRVVWEHIQRVLTENDGNISATARALKMHRRTLQRKLSKRPARD
jgi:two-component system response regulator RegA